MLDINITGRNLDLDKSIKAYLNKKLGKLEKVYKRIYKCEVVLDEEKVRKNAEIILYLKRNRIVAKESSPDMYASIDNACDNVKKQLRRLSGRVSSRRRKAMFGRFMKPAEYFGISEDTVVAEPRGFIVKADFFASKPMLPEEARLELDMMEKVFITFKNADTGEVNVLYKRADGDYGLIEPKF
ncbi:MAG: ribosome-associated translation inhibitor RaiA [Candidatus Tantalella remota]|nr:ribosome-associated translation inhibitor RaiA [Candidatus Tantalella remota]